MAKHVFANRELAHAFFHQHEFGIDWGRGSSFSFESNRIYSYSSIIGIADFKKKLFLFRSANFSQSTSKHQANIRYAIPNDWKIYYWNKWHTFYSTEAYCEQLLDVLIEQKKYLYSGIKSFGSDVYEETLEQLDKFTKDLKCRKLYSKYKRKFDKYKWTEEDFLVLAVKTWAYNNGMLGSYKKKLKYYNNPTLKSLVEERFQKELSDKEEKARQKVLKQEKKEQELLDKWLVGEYHNNLYNVPIHLKIAANESFVMTTLGALVPLFHCELLYKKFRYCIASNTEWESNGHSIPIGNYKVSKIQQRLRSKYPNVVEWSILAGCHLIFETEIEKFIESNNLQKWRV